jgi:hypothetical protein
LQGRIPLADLYQRQHVTLTTNFLILVKLCGQNEIAPAVSHDCCDANLIRLLPVLASQQPYRIGAEIAARTPDTSIVAEPVTSLVKTREEKFWGQG